ncbi:MAG: hypothetical protein NC349_09925 [Paenibacillus sp.]|nr:hypothetical protein [Paenibacillus sp.]
MVKKIILIMIALMLLPIALLAQKPSPREREAWMKEMQQVKNEYIARKLELSDEQKTKFLPLYNRMDEEMRQVAEQAMRMERDVRKKGAQATDLEYEKAAEAQFELKGKENRIELKYFKDFKTMLTPHQLFKLKKAERDFSRELMKKHNERKRDNKKK